jgi:hypothetical protein
MEPSGRRPVPRSAHLPVLALFLLVPVFLLAAYVGNAQEARNQAIEGLLTTFAQRLRAEGLQPAFDPALTDPGAPAPLSEEGRRKLAEVTRDFLKQLGANGLTVDSLRRYKADARNANAAPGEVGAEVGGQWWNERFLVAERALMTGRVEVVGQAWEQGLADYLATQGAESFATVYGEMDIGSWVKRSLGKMTFEGDIDLSSLCSNSQVNLELVDYINRRLQTSTSLKMDQLTVTITAHGQGGFDVYIGNWGRKWAEMDLLRRGTCKIVRVTEQDGQPRVTFEATTGERLLWERAFRQNQAFEPPKITLADEPMISLELNRHVLLEVQQALAGENVGPYSAAQAAIKVIKLTHRSYLTAQKAGAASGWDPFVSNNPTLAAAMNRINQTADPSEVARILEALTGGRLNGQATPEQAMQVVTDLMTQAQKAIDLNASRGLALRLLDITKIAADADRASALKQLWGDLRAEIDAYNRGNPPATPPERLTRILDLGLKYEEGKLTAAEQTELERMLSELDAEMKPTVLERLFGGEAVVKFKSYLREKLGWTEEAVNHFVAEAKKRNPNLAKVHEKVQEFNEKMAQTIQGSALLKMNEWAFVSISVYDAYWSAPNSTDGFLAAAKEFGTLAALMKWPWLWMPKSIYDACHEGSPAPVIMGVAFWYMPWTFHFYAAKVVLERVDAQITEADFASAIADMLAITEFQDGKICKFVGNPDEDITPPGDRAAIVARFEDPLSWLSSSPGLRYWRTLIPDEFDRFSFNTKLDRLERFFPTSGAIRSWTGLLRATWGTPENLPNDQWRDEREKMLQSLKDELRKALWVALADTLEAAIKGANEDELKKEIARLEKELWFDDGAIQKKIEEQKRQNYSFWSALLKGEGNKVWVLGFIYDTYIKSYQKIEQTRKAVLTDLWALPFGINVSKGQDDPLKLYLMGKADRSAPLLLADYKLDGEVAARSLDAHTQRAKKVNGDLSLALGRAVDPAQDRDHLKFLGQLAFEMEHLTDAAKDRAAGELSPAELDALTSRGKQYNAYLALIGATPSIKGDDKTDVDKPLELSGQLQPQESLRQFLPPITLNWTVDGRADLTTTGDKFVLNVPVANTYTVHLQPSADIGGQLVQGRAVTHQVTVGAGKGPLKFEIAGPDGGKVEDKLTFTARVTAGDLKTVENPTWRWLVYGLLAEPTQGESFDATFREKGDYTVRLELWTRKANGAETQVAYQTRPITIKDLDRAVVIECPNEVVETEVFTTTAKLSADLAGRALTYDWGWDMVGTPKDTASVKQQFLIYERRTEMKTEERTITVTLQDAATKKTAGTGQKKVTVYPAKLGGTAPGIWEGGPHPRGIDLKRKEAKAAGTWEGKPVEAANVWANAWAHWGRDSLFLSPEKPEDVPALMEKERGDRKDWTIQPVAFDGFTGALILKPVYYSRGGWSFDAGYRGAGISTSGYGVVMKGRQIISIGFSVGGGGWFDNSQRPFMELQATQAQREALAFLNSLKVTRTGEMIRTPYQGPALDGSDMPVVKVMPDKAKARVGEIVTLKAVVENLRDEDKPLQYQWSEGADGKQDTAFFQPTKAGAHTVSCTVTGARFGLGTGTAQIEAEDLKVVVERVPAAEDNKVVVGQPIALKAVLTSAGQPYAGDFVYRWESRDLGFATQDSPTTETSVTLKKPGNNPVWVCVLYKKADGELGTLVESDRLELEAVQPGLQVVFEPGKPYIGQETRAKVVITPEIPDKDLDVRWEFTGAVQELGESTNSRERTFLPKSDKPITYTARARVPGTGEDLGTAEGTLTAQPFKVTTGHRVVGPPALVWKPGVGLVEKTTAIAVHQEVVLTAAVDPAPFKEPVKYRWSFDNDDNSFVTVPEGKEVTVTRSQVGTCQAKVVVEDGNGYKLGEAPASFNASISQAQIDDGKSRKQAEEDRKNVRLALSAPKNRAAVGEGVEVQCQVTGNKPEDNPLQYTWTGDFEGEGAKVTFRPTKPGKQTLTCAVKGARFEMGQARLDFDVQDRSVVVLITSAPPFTVGSKLSLYADYRIAGVRQVGQFITRWEVDGGAVATPAEATGPYGSVVCPRPGTYQVKVSVLEMPGGSSSTKPGPLVPGRTTASRTPQVVAVSAPLTIDVGKPQLALSLAPEFPWVGQDIKATVRVTPPVEGARFEWKLSDNGLLQAVTEDTTGATLIARDSRPVEVTVRGVAPRTGDELGQATATVKARAMMVSAELAGAVDPPAKLYRPGQGLVEEAGAFAVNQRLRLRARVQPQPTYGPATFKWTADEGSKLEAADGEEVSISRAQVGTGTATVTVSDAKGATLGTGTVTFSVTVSQQQMDEAVAQATRADQNQQQETRLAEARNLAIAGNLTEAVTVAREVAAANPALQDKANQVIADVATRSRDAATRAIANDLDFAAARKSYDFALELEPENAAAKTGLANVAAWEKSWGDAHGRMPELDDLVNRKRVFSAEKLAAEIRASVQGIPCPAQVTQFGNELSQKVTGLSQQYRAAFGAFDRDMRDTLYMRGDAARAVELGKKMLDGTWEMPPEDEKSARFMYFRAEGLLAEKARLLEDAINWYDKAVALDTYRQDMALAVHTQDLRNAVTGARMQKAEGEKAEQAGRRREALGYYEKALAVMVDDALTSHVQDLHNAARARLSLAPTTGSALAVSLPTPMTGSVVASKLPADNLRISLSCTYDTPGAILDMAGIAPAADGALALRVAPGGLVQMNVFRHPPGQGERWHVIQSKTPLAGYKEQQIDVVYSDGYWGLFLNGQFEEWLDLDTQIAQGDMYVGDFKADDWMTAYNFKTGIQGSVKVKYVGTVDGLHNLIKGSEPAPPTPPVVAGPVAVSSKTLANRRWDTVTLVIPDNWTEDNSPDRGSWYLGDAKNPEASVTLRWVTSTQARLDELKAAIPDLTQDSQGTSSIMGKQATFFELSSATRKTRMWLLLAKDLGGKGVLALQFTAPTARFDTHQTSFMLIQGSVKVQAAATQPVQTQTPAKTGAFRVLTPSLAKLHEALEDYTQQMAVTFTVQRDGTVTGQLDEAKMLAALRADEGFRAAKMITNALKGTVAGNRFTAHLDMTVDLTYELLGAEKGRIVTVADFTGTVQPDGTITGRCHCTLTPGAPNLALDPQTTDWDFVAKQESAAQAPPTTSAATPATTSGVTVTATLENKSTENVHIFAEGETFGAQNRLAPGETRQVAVKMAANGAVKFTVGRNGTVLGTKTWFGDPDSPNRVPRVVFTAEGSLLIMTSLR